jgi:peptide/nickel transport system substrate-binding protein
MFFRTDLPESPFSIKEVRQAMMLAIDQQSVIDDYWQGEAIILNWPLTPHIAYEEAMPDLDELPADVQALYGHDVAAAQALLATTPYPNGFDCTVLCWDTPIMIDILSMFQSMLADININMELDVLDYNVYLSRTRARNHTAYEIMYTTDAGNGTYMKMINFRGSNSYNVSHIDEDYSVPEIEEAYAAMQPYVGVDEAAMMAINKELMPWLLEQAYCISASSPIMTNMWWPWVKNYYGCVYVGYYNSYGTPKYVWIDEDLKESMGY